MKRYFTYITILIFLYSSVTAQTNYYCIPWQQYNIERTPETGNMEWTSSADPLTETVQTPAFQISRLITVKEYRSFLNAQKAVLPKAEYDKLLPDSAYFRAGTFQEYIYGNTYDDCPIVAITWESTIAFCRWKTISENEGDSIRFIYRLPTLQEWWSARRVFKNIHNGHDFSTSFSEWILLDSFEEYLARQNLNNISTDISPSGSSFKKSDIKRIIGKSFIRRNPVMEITGRTLPATDASQDVGFRCMKVYITRLPMIYNDSILHQLEYLLISQEEYKLLSSWNLIFNVVTDQNKTEKYNSFACDRTWDYKNKKNYLSIGFYKSDNESDFWSQPKSMGEYMNGKKYGAWYTFTKKGALSAAKYYSGSGKKTNIRIDGDDDAKVYCRTDRTFLNPYEFADSLKHLVFNSDSVTSDKKYIYSTFQGRKNGWFTYSDFDMCIAGRYADNMKTGMWCMWDCEEHLLMQRDYKNGHEYEVIYSALPQNKLTALLDGTKYSLVRNEDGFYDYFQVGEHDIGYSKTVWRTLLPDENPLLFEETGLIKTIRKHIESGDIGVYKESDRPYRRMDTLSSEEALSLLDTEEYELCAIRIKEDNFFDFIRYDMECRAGMIMPVVRNKETGHEKELFWINVADIRKFLAQERISGPGLPDIIQTLDDLFFFRYYSGMIYREANLYGNRKISDYAYGKGIKQEAQFIENMLLDMEFGLWKFYNTDFEQSNALY